MADFAPTSRVIGVRMSVAAASPVSPLAQRQPGQIGWKKVRDPDDASILRLCRLTIPDHAEIIHVGAYRRASLAFVEEIEGAESGVSMSDPLTVYLPGSWITPASGFDPNPTTPCAGGIHFFASRAEAEARWRT